MANRTDAMLEEIRGMFKALADGFAGHTEAIADLRARMERTEEKQDAMGMQISALVKGQAALRSDVSVLKQDVSALKQDVSVLKQEVSVLKQDVSVLKQDVSVLKQDVSVLKQDVSVLKQDVAVLKQDVAGVKADLSAVRLDLKNGLAHLGERWLEHDRDIYTLKRIKA